MEKKFQVLGAEVPQMFGRKKMLENLVERFSKEKPDNISLVGPRYSGKSVFANAFVEVLTRFGKKALLWDLRINTPQSDSEFFKQLTAKIVRSLPSESVEHEYLKAVEENHFSDLRDFFDTCKEPFTLVMEGFDDLLASDHLSKNLWDNLLTLIKGPSCVMLTTSRKVLRELIRSQETAGSLFWEAFDANPIRMPPLSELDRQDFYYHSVDPAESVKTMLFESSGGFPPLFAHCLNTFLKKYSDASLEEISRLEFLAKAFDDEAEQILDPIWRGLNVESKDFLIALKNSSKSGLSSNSFNCNRSDLRDLEYLGFIKKQNTCYHICCSLLQEFLCGKSETSGPLQRIFSTMESYEKIIKEVLERKFSFVSEKLPPELKKPLDRVISDIPEDPKICLRGMREVMDKVVAIISREEFPDGKIPESLTFYRRNEKRKHSGRQ